ncbi:MAG: O-antigen translocase [Gammaproteobacteria bacterium]|nr:O-antigen translocase [Gammaproteobacteria bacterium]
MSDSEKSYRRILKSSSIIGGASVVNIAMGMIRTKVLAILLGPTGVGLVGLLTAVMSTAIAVASMGIGVSGARKIAEANSSENHMELALARKTIFWSALFLATVGGLVIWFLADVLAIFVLGDSKYSWEISWLALGVAFSVGSASQGAMLQGMRRVGDIAKVSVYSSTLNALIGSTLLWFYRNDGLVAFIVLAPLLNFILGHLFVARLPRYRQYKIKLIDLYVEHKALMKLGFAFMAAGLINTLVQLWIRVEVERGLGVEALGYYQAAWMISMQYVGFVLAAMVADYYPRLSGVITNKSTATKVVNEQTEVALLLSAPIFIAMMGLAPWAISILYSSTFMPAVDVLRWQILGDVLKVASWPLGFVLLAAGDGKSFFWTEALVLSLMGGLVAGFVEVGGLNITGIAFLACYVFYLPLVYFLAKRRIDFRWTGTVIRLVVVTFVLCASVALLCQYTNWGIVVSLVVSTIFGVYSLGRIAHVSNMGGPVGKIGSIARAITNKMGLRSERL